MLITLKHKKIAESLGKKVYGEKHSFIKLTYVEGAHWNCLIEAIPMCTTYISYVIEIKETYFEIYIYQESCPLALPQSANQY